MNIGIIGSPGYSDQLNLNSILDYLLKETDVESIISDSSGNIGTLADQYSFSRGILSELVATSDVITQSDWVVAFWDGASIDTKNQLDRASKLGKQITINRVQIPKVKVEPVTLEEFF